jgi:hypothetical protein
VIYDVLRDALALVERIFLILWYSPVGKYAHFPDEMSITDLVTHHRFCEFT